MIIESTKAMALTDKCPQCSKSGKFFEQEVNIPFKTKFLFFNIAGSIKVKLQYCANCGFLRVTVG